MKNITRNIRVAKVINEYKIVINKGSLHGIEIGQRFLVYSLSKEEIIDPESGQNLGRLEIVKGTGTVTHLQEQIATIESDRKSKAVRKTIKKPLLTFSQFSGEEEIIEPAETIPFEDIQVNDFVKGL